MFILRAYQLSGLSARVYAFIYNDKQYQPSQTVIETEAAIYEAFGTAE